MPERTLSVERPAVWRVTGAASVGAITWLTSLVGLLAVISIVLPAGRRGMRGHVAEWLGLSREATTAAAAVVLAVGVLLILLASGLRRRKRRAWQLALAASVGGGERAGRDPGAEPPAVRRAAGPGEKWVALRVFLQLLLAGFVINVALLSVAPERFLAPLSFPDRMAQAALALFGVGGPAVFHVEWMDDLTTTVGLLFGLGAVLLAVYFLLRSAEPAPHPSEDERARLQALLDKHGARDSLGYFALRDDKFVVFSKTGKAALTYRVIAGAAVASADPLGDN